MRLLAVLALACGLLGSRAWAGPMEETQANIHFNVALKLYQTQKLDDAKATLAKALALVPDHPQANFLTGLIDCQQNHFEDAIAPLKIAAAGLQDKPETLADVLTNLGVAYFQLDKLADAEDALKRASALQPQRADVAMNLGLVALRMKQYPAAETYFSRAADLDKGSSRAWLGLGEAADGAGDTRGALSAREQALSLEPQDKTLRLELGQRLYQAQSITQAVEVLQPLQGTGDATAEFLLGVLQYRQGAFDASRERFEAALAARPDYPEARFNLAITFYDQGLFEEALKQFQSVLDKHPDDQDARKNLDITRAAAVRSWLKTGSEDFLKADYASALARWKAALGLDPGNKVVKDLVDTAETQLKLQAQELADQARKDWDQGKKEAAISGWAQALECDAGNASAKQGLEGAKAEIDKMADAFKQAAADDVAAGRWSMAREESSRVTNLDKAMGQALAQKVETAAKAQFDEAMGAADTDEQEGALAQRVDSLERAVEAEPRDDAAQLKLNQAKVAYRSALDGALAAADAAEKADNNDEAVRQFRKVLDLQASNPTAKDGLKRLGAKASAKGVDPSALEDLYYKGVYAYAAGNVEVAEADWKQVLQLDPKHTLAREALDRSRRNREAAGRN
jgi:tetratricopeptide (TPR) repeat protein